MPKKKQKQKKITTGFNDHQFCMCGCRWSVARYLLYSYTYISYCFSGNVNTPLPHVAYLIYLYQHVFMLAIVFSVLLRHTDYDYPSGIFKLFLHHIYLYYSSKQQLSNGRTLHINSETKTHISCQKKISALFLR